MSRPRWPVHLATLVAGVGVVVWLLANPRTPDLAAQVYRANLFRQIGFSVWDERWYAGHHLPGYSLVFPPLAALIGVRTVGALAVLTSTVLFERTAHTLFDSRPARWGSVWFAVAAVGDAWIGRLTFALGVAFALGAVWALLRGRTGRAAVVAVLCAATSPVLGVMLAMAAVSWVLARRAWRGALSLGAPAVALALGLALLFPEGGWEPFPTLSFVVTALVVVGFLWVLPDGRPDGEHPESGRPGSERPGVDPRTLRVGAVVYLVACVGSLVVHSPMGSNIERYGVLLAGPLLVCVLGRGVWRPKAMVVLCAIAVWTVWGPVRETVAVAGNASTGSSYYAPVARFVREHGGPTVRVEVPFTRGHWESTWLAPTVSLARGWEKQLDTRYDSVLLSQGLTAEAYHRWLRAQAVSFVALPDTTLDPSSAREGRLVRAGLPYLRLVYVSRHWKIFEVLGSRSMAEGPGRLAAMGHNSFALSATSAGRFLVRVRFTRYWAVTRGNACIRRAPGGWTSVAVGGAGSVEVRARFSIGRALGESAAGPCPIAAH
jgi:hypothetical protein